MVVAKKTKNGAIILEKGNACDNSAPYSASDRGHRRKTALEFLMFNVPLR